MKNLFKRIFIILIIIIPPQASSYEIDYFSSYEYRSAVKSHYLALGARINMEYFSLEISNGIKKASRKNREANKVSNGTLISIDIYPFQNSQSKNKYILSASHLSDIFRGQPFNDEEEPVDHFFGIGFLKKSDQYESKILFGKESHDCSLDRKCEYRNQIKASFKYIF